MLDVWIFDGLLLITAALWPFLLLRRGVPPLRNDGSLALPDLAAIQARYERAYPWRLGFRTAFGIAAIYFTARAAAGGDPHAYRSVPGFAPFAGLLGVTFLVALTAATLIRCHRDLTFVQIHPAFAASVLPLRFRLVPLLLLGVPIGLFAWSMTRTSSVEAIGSVVAALLFFFVGLRLQLRAMRRRGQQLALESPFGRRVAHEIARFGFAPKRFVVTPSLLMNGYALRDGTVGITSALQRLLTEDEIAAVLAHELSHARDGDARWIVRGRVLILLALYVWIALLTLGMVSGFGTNPYEVPAIVGWSVMALYTGVAVLSRSMRRAEFKCDRDARALGLGAPLASALNKIHRYGGAPEKWIGVDRWLVTHPSLEDRTAALVAASRETAA